MKSSRFLALLAAISLSFGAVSCGDDSKDKDDDKSGTSGVTGDVVVDDDIPVGEGVKDESFKTDLKACNFVNASKTAEAAYSDAKSSSKMAGELAFERSILGLINLVHNESIQSILPKYGFTSASNDFSATWKDGGLFEVMQNVNEDFDDVVDALPHKYNKGFDVIETIDKNVTLAETFEALRGAESQLASLAESFEIAAVAFASNKEMVSLNGAGCGLDGFKFDSADLYTVASLLRLTVSMLELSKSYNFDIKVTDLYNYFDRYDDVMNGEDECYRESKGSCKRFCDELDGYLAGALSALFKTNGTKNDGRSSFVAAARLLQAAVNASDKSTSDSFFGWFSMPDGSKNDLLKITKNIVSDPVVSLSGLVTPTVDVDLNKVFDTPVSRSNDLKTFCFLRNYDDDEETLRDHGILGLNDFYMEFVNTVTDAKVIAKEKNEYYEPEYDSQNEEYEYPFNDRYSSNFSSAWNNVKINNILDPHAYFRTHSLGLTFDEGDDCDPDTYKSRVEGNIIVNCHRYEYVDAYDCGENGGTAVLKDGIAVCEGICSEGDSICDGSEYDGIVRECTEYGYYEYSESCDNGCNGNTCESPYICNAVEAEGEDKQACTELCEEVGVMCGDAGACVIMKIHGELNYSCSLTPEVCYEQGLNWDSDANHTAMGIYYISYSCVASTEDVVCESDADCFADDKCDIYGDYVQMNHCYNPADYGVYQEYRYVKVQDESPVSSDGADPGADIDAVVLRKPDGSMYYAVDVKAYYRGDGLSSNEKNKAFNPEAIIGAPNSVLDVTNPDGTCNYLDMDQTVDKENDAHYTFVSLGGKTEGRDGGFIVVEMQNAIENGDELIVVELGDCDLVAETTQAGASSTAKAEEISVSVSVSDDYYDSSWIPVINSATAVKGVVSDIVVGL